MIAGFLNHQPYFFPFLSPFHFLRPWLALPFQERSLKVSLQVIGVSVPRSAGRKSFSVEISFLWRILGDVYFLYMKGIERSVYFRVCCFAWFRYLFIVSKWRQVVEVIVLVLLVLLADCAAINPTRNIAIWRIFSRVS